MIRRLVLAAVCVGGLGSAWAQEGLGPGPAGGGGRARDEIFRMVDAYILSNLQESLALSDEQFVKILPLLKRLQSDRRSFIERRHEMLMEMRRQLESGRATEARVSELLRDLKALESDEPGVLRRDREALDGVLTPLQQAKLRILEVQVEHKIRELTARVRAGPGGRRNPGP